MKSLLTIILPVLAAFGAADASAHEPAPNGPSEVDWVCAKVTFRQNYFAGTGLREADADAPAWVNLNKGIGYVLVRDDDVPGNRIWEGFFLAANVQMKVPDPTHHANRVCPRLHHRHTGGWKTLCDYGDIDEGAREDNSDPLTCSPVRG